LPGFDGLEGTEGTRGAGFRIIHSAAVEKFQRLISPSLLTIAAAACLIIATMLLVIVWLSFTDGIPGDPDLKYTLQNYRDVLLDPSTYQIIGNTLVFACVTLVVAMGLGLPLAWLVERTDLPGKTLILTLMTLGLLIPGFSVALGWVFLLNERIGILNRFLMQAFSLHAAPLNIATLPGMGCVEGISLAPVVFIMTSTVLRAIDYSFEEAALSAGATWWIVIRRITFPLARPGIVAAGIYVLVIGFGAFDVPAVIGLGGRIYTFSTFMYTQVNSNEGLPKFGTAACLSVIMGFAALALTWWYNKMQGQTPRYAVVTGKAYRFRPVQLGHWRPVAIGFIAIFFFVAQAFPALVLVWTSCLPFLQTPSVAAIAQLSLQNYWNLPSDFVLPALRNTAVLMIAVPTITLVVSFAISWSVMRSSFRYRRIFDFFAFLPHAIPSIVFAVATWLLSLFVLAKFVPAYGTIWLLIAVYAVVRLSYGTRVLNSALIQIHRELEESATMSGATLWGIIRRILVPLLYPTLSYSWIWIALLTYRELTLPVVLASSDSRPMAVVVWSLISSASYGQASAVAVLMLLLMVPIVSLYWIAARRMGPQM